MSIEATILDKLVDLIGRKAAFLTQLIAWITGTATGGPSGDGKYPITSGDVTTLVPSVPKLLADLPAGGGASFTVGAITSLPEVTETSEDDLLPLAHASTGGAIMAKGRFGTFFINHIKGLREGHQLVGTEIIPSLTAAPGSIEQGIALREIERLFSGGVINVTMPPYNCKGDCRIVKDAVSTAGSKTITSASGLFRPEDVGKPIHLSNAGGNYSRKHTVIEAYVSPTEIRTSGTSSVSYGGNGIPHVATWGTDNTAGLQQALADARSTGPFNYGAAVLIPPGQYFSGALKYYARQAIVGYGPRTSVLVRLHETAPTYDGFAKAQLYNDSGLDDFPQIQNIGLYGNRYMQYKQSDQLSFVNNLGNTPENDPCPFFAHLHLYDGSKHGLYTRGKHSGTHIGIDVYSSGYAGWMNQSFDVNALNFLVIACGWSGYMSGEPNYSDVSAANCNIVNMKSSYNGQNALEGFLQETGGNLYECGAHNTFQATRLQESWASSLVLGGNARDSVFNGTVIQDTACIRPGHGGGKPANLVPVVRAGLYIGASGGVSNGVVEDVKFHECDIGRGVHENADYLSHAVFFSRNSNWIRGSATTRKGTTYGTNVGSGANTVANGTGAYAPAKTGTDSSGGGLGAQGNTITID